MTEKGSREKPLSKIKTPSLKKGESDTLGQLSGRGFNSVRTLSLESR